MSTEMPPCTFAGQDPGPYVLGALSPAERIAFERHLPGCADCRCEVASLAVLPGLLGRLDRDAAIAIVTNPRPAAHPTPESEQRLTGLLARVVGQRRTRVRRQRWRIGFAGAVGAVAVALVAVMVLGLPGTGRGRGPQAQPSASSAVQLVAMTVVGDAPVTAEIGLAPTAGGTAITMHCAYQESRGPDDPYAGAGGLWTLRLYATGRDGKQEEVSSWKAGPGDSLNLTGTTRYAMNELTRLDVKRGDGTVVLTYTVA